MGNNVTTEHVNETMTNSVAEPKPFAKPSDIKKAIPIRDSLRYIQNDTYVADVSAVLGRVYYENIDSDELIPFFMPLSAEVDPNSKLSTPLTVSELIVDSKAKVNFEALSFLKVELSADELLEVRVINNSAARLIDKGDSWDAAVTKWMGNDMCKSLINDQNVGTISVVTGAVQKYFTTKKYRKYEAGAKGGGWGVNVEGSLYTSTSQFDLSIVYGLDLVTFKRAKNINEFAANLAKKNIVSSAVDLKHINRLFTNMAMSRSSIFRITDV